ncbi:MAG: hypothetical protein ACREFD_12730 [Stellaceae bacterium]
MTRRIVLALAACLAASVLLPCAGLAAGPPARLRATVEKFDHNVLTVKTEMGQVATVDVTPKTKISGVAARKLSDIKPDDYIGVTAMKAKDGSLHAIEVHIFPPPMRGVGEGHYPFDRGPTSTMTNAVVSGIVTSGNGDVFTLAYKKPKIGKPGAVKIDIGRHTPIVIFVPGDRSLLVPGARVVMFAAKKPDGTYAAFVIVAEKNGVKPPM